MPLTPGTRLGPYEISALLGAGGMGEVYRARDTRLGRDVAIKVLPEAFAADPERLARFEREARLLASLNHPNVAGIYGLDEVEGHRYLALEFVEGETLADRIQRGPIPPDDAVDICRQIAEGVEAAHEAGVVHRDLKPGNVMLMPDGSVKVLDFGLAKSGAPGPPGSDPSLTASPTLTAAATTAGVILGTAAYMSPEQARGRTVDKRSDVWSFGCVLYECLTGRKAFEGDIVSDTIAAILRSHPDLRALPASTPPRVRELLERCLARDPRERLRDIGEARVLLASVAAGGAAAPEVAASRGRGVPASLAVGGSFALAALAVVLTLFVTRGRAPAPVRKFDLSAEGIEASWSSAPQLSPDGSQIAYTAGNRIWVRSLDQVEPRHVADVEGTPALCWSPDSRELVFDDRKTLWKILASGGAPMQLCSIPGTGNLIGVTWSARGTLAMSVWRDGIYSVPAGGGAVLPLVAIEPGRIVDFHSPTWLPNGQLLYVVHWTGTGQDSAGPTHDVEVLAGGRRVPVTGLLGDDSEPILTSTGRLLFLRRGANPGIWCAEFDPVRRRVTGEPQLVAAGAKSISVSNDGSLLYVEGSDNERPREIVWVDRAGTVLASTGQAYPGLGGLALSPDGRRVAFTAREGAQSDVWVRDLVRGGYTRITFAKSEEYSPHWLGPDRLSYAEQSDSTGGLRCRLLAASADGSGQITLLAPPTGSSVQLAYFTPDRGAALRVIDEAGHGRLRLADVRSDGGVGPPRPFARFTPEPDVLSFGINASGASLSPDGRHVAYANNDERPEVFLVRFPGGEGPWQVSSEGGRNVHWARGTNALYYVAGTGPSRRWLAEVAIDSSHDPPVGRTTRLFDIEPIARSSTTSISYDVDAGGRRFLIAREVPGAAGRPASMVLVQNWEAALAGK